MPSKHKNAPKNKEQNAPLANPSNPEKPPPITINERSTLRFEAGNPLTAKIKEQGFSALTPEEQSAWINIKHIRSVPNPNKLGLPPKATKEFWKIINESDIPLRGLDEKEAERVPGDKVYDWGVDAAGRDIGEYTIEEFERRKSKGIRLTILGIQGRSFEKQRLKAGGFYNLSEEVIAKERDRREEVAKLRMELYREKKTAYDKDPEWDDIIPIPQKEGENALASIAYTEEYATAIAYLRAVMAKKEHSPRCLRLSESIIMMNPAHYTVWLYRFAIIQALNISLLDELAWLNKISLTHLKNYQIWQHRQLLLDHYYPVFVTPEGADQATAENNEEVRKFALSELEFLKEMLDQDTKNYHVWSYRQYLVRKLGMFDMAEEMQIIETMILEDIRNNSAWCHRFFLVFANPRHCTIPEIPVTQADPKVPTEVIEREIKYTMPKIEESPQNQSSWNYLKGVITRGGRDPVDMEMFCQQFVDELGNEENEDVRSTYALEMLAEIWAKKGGNENLKLADLALTRLAEKWDRVRAGYWGWRKKCFAEDKV